MRAVILLGAPGSGKGTVAEDLSASSEFCHLSTGDMLRNYIRTEHPVGLEANEFIKRGELVPDEVIVKLVEDHVSNYTGRARFLFDGFPRTVVQAEKLDELIDRLGGKINHACLLEVQDETALRRIAGRRVCSACGVVYNVNTMPPKEKGVCDGCRGELFQRPDDIEATVMKRLTGYNARINGLVDYFKAKSIFRRIDAEDRKETELAILDLIEQDRGES